MPPFPDSDDRPMGDLVAGDSLAEQRFRLALAAANMGSFDWDVRRNVVTWDDRLTELFGYRDEPFPGTFEAFLARVHPDDRERVDDAIRGAGEHAGGYDVVYRVVWPDGSVRWIAAAGYMLRGPAGEPERMLGLAYDVTRRHSEGERARFLAEAGEILAASLDYDATLRRVAELAVPRLADWCAVTILGEDGRARNVAVAHVDPDRVRLARQLQERFPPEADAPGGVPMVLRTGRSVLYPRIEAAMLAEVIADPEQLGLTRQLQLSSLIIAPLVARGRTLGALTLAWAESGHRYDEDDQRFAEELGRRAGLAVDNAGLLRAAEGARREAEILSAALERLIDIGPAIGEEGTEATVAAAISEAAVRSLGADWAAVWVHEGDGARLLSRRPATDLFPDGLRLSFADMIDGGASMRAARPYFVQDVRTEFPDADLVARSGIGASLVVPLIRGGHVHGSLTLSWRQPIEPPSAGSMAVAQRFADQALLALENVRRREAQREVAVIHAQLEASLLPNLAVGGLGSRIATRYRPGEDRMLLGGDFLDAVELEDGSLAVLVGDVSGHGPSAAALGATLRAAWRGAVLAGADGARTLTALQGVLERERPEPDVFATVCTAVLSGDGRRLRLQLAGHPPPVSIDGMAVMPDAAPGPPLGVVPAAAWETVETDVLEDGALLFFTDGAIEGRAMPDAEGRFGVDGMLEWLRARGPASRAERLLDELLDAITAAHGSRLPDDVALLLVQTARWPGG